MMEHFHHDQRIVSYNRDMSGDVMFDYQNGFSVLVDGDLLAAFFRHLCEEKYQRVVEHKMFTKEDVREILEVVAFPLADKEETNTEEARQNHWTLDDIMKNEG